MPTDAEAGYAAAIVQITQGYVDALRTLGEQSRLAGNNPALMVNDTWKIKTVIALGLLKFHGDQVRQLSAPSQRFAGVHADLLNAADNFDACADLYARGVDALSGDLLNQASQRMNAGNEAIQRASEKLRALQR